MPIEYNPNTNWLTQVWTVLCSAARLPGMDDDILVHYAMRIIKRSSMVPVYESTPIAQVRALGDVCWSEIVLLWTAVMYCEDVFIRHDQHDMVSYAIELANALAAEICEWEDYEDYLNLLNEEGNNHE